MKISTIIPVFNQEKYLEQCLDSVINQSFSDIEIICIDDASTDSSSSILDAYAQKDSRIKVLKQQNAGAGAARNLGLRHANGEYVHFLDSDDWLERHAYKELSEKMENHAADFIVFLYKKYNNVTSEVTKAHLFPIKEGSHNETSFAETHKHFLNTSVVPWNKFYRKSYLDNIGARFDETKVANDRSFYIQTMVNSNRILLFSSYLINYRTNNPSSLIGNNRQWHFDCILAASTRTQNLLKEQTLGIRSMGINFDVSDIFGWYESATQEQMKFILPKLINHFNSLDSTIINQSLTSAPWYPKYKAIKNLVQIVNVDPAKIIPIVMATNDNYAPYLHVTLLSIAENLSKDSFCDIYVFHSGLSLENLGHIESFKRDNIRVQCINVKPLVVSQMEYIRAHYSIEMYYRFLIPEILRHYEKVIYLDCDLVTNKDIKELYDIEISDAVLAGVPNFYNESMFRWVKNSLKLDPNNYINSGVLLINTKAFIEKNIKSACIKELQSRDFLACPDQDALNIACNGFIKLIDSGWNFQWHHAFEKYKKSETIEFSKPVLENASSKKYIVHYTSGAKAWNHPLYENASDFWSYARESIYYKNIISINANNKLSRINEMLSEARKN